MGALHFEADVDINKFQTKVNKIDTELASIANKASKSGSIMDNSFKQAGNSAGMLGDNLGKMAAAYFSIDFAGRIGREIINVRGEFQQLGIAFEVMLGSKEKADKLMAEQIAFSQKTPFTLTDVATNTKQLLAMGIGLEKVMGTMKDLGNVAAGVSVPISRIAINYGQVATLGTLQGRELRDFAMAGIPLVDELAKNLGKAKSEIADMVTAGKIGFPDVEKAFQTMAGEGGKFYNLMEKQNTSVTGQISNLTDKLQVMMNELGKSNEGLIYGGISGLTTLVAHYKDIISILEVLAISYGTVKAAMIAVSAYESVMAGIDATRTKIIAGKVAVIQAEFAAQDAAAAKAKILAAEESAMAAKQLATEQSLAVSGAKVTAAKLANVKATQDLAAAELELQIVQARNTAAYNAGFMTLKASQNVKKEMLAVDKAYSTLKKTEVVVDKAITADTVLNESVKAQAVITGEAEKTAAKVQATAASRALIVANEQATASEIAMASINPWMIAAAGIALLVGAIIYFKKEVKSTEELVTDLNKSMGEIDKQIEIESAINKYDNLKDKVGKTKDEQTELNGAIKTLSAIFPDAIGKTDQYGKAIDLLPEKLKNASNELRKYTKEKAEAAKTDAEASRQKNVDLKNEYQAELNKGYTTTPDESGVMIKTPLSPEGIKLRKNKIIELSAEIENLGKTIGDESAKIYELASVGAEAFIEKNAKLFKKVGEYSRESARSASGELLSMLGSDGGRADAAILKQVSALTDYANGIKTVKEQTDFLQTSLSKAKKELADMELPTYESKAGTPLQDVAAKKAEIKEIEDKLGLHEKEKKAVDELKLANEALEKAVKSGNEAAIQAAAAKVAMLEKEEKKIKDLIDWEVYRAKQGKLQTSINEAQAGNNAPMAEMTTQGSTQIARIGQVRMFGGVMQELVEIDKKGKQVWKNRKADTGELAKFAKDKYKDAAEDQKKLDEEKKKRQEEIIQQGLQFMDNMLHKYGEQLGMTEEEAGLISSLARGDYFAAAFNMIGVMSKFFKTEKDGLSEYYQNLDDQTKKLIDNLDLVNKSLSNIGTGGSFQSFNVLSSELVKLKNDAARLNDQLIITGSDDGRRGSGSQGATTNGNRTDEENRARTILDLSKQTSELYAEIDRLTYRLLDPNLTEEQRKAIVALLNSYNSIVDSINASVQEITGTSIQGLSNSLIDAFMSGEDAAVKWGDTVDGIIKNVVKKQLVAQLLTEPITQAINKLINDSSNGLTPDEASKFATSMDSLYTTTKPIIDLVNGSFKTAGINLSETSDSASKPLTGISASLTEETGSLLNGQFMAMRVDMKTSQNIAQNQLELMDVSLSVLNNIDRNTRPISRLETIEAGINETNRILKEKL